MRRTQGALKMFTSLRDLEKKKFEEQKKFITESNKIKKDLEKFEDRFTKAHHLSLIINNQRAAVARSSNNVHYAINKVKRDYEIGESDCERKYIKTIEKIKSCKSIRDKTFNQFKIQIESKYKKKKLLQIKNYNRIMEIDKNKKSSTLKSQIRNIYNKSLVNVFL